MSEYLHFLNNVHPWAMRVWFFGFGACVGSFLNVCILRIPAGKSIVYPGSHCACGKPIAWYDNIPILSWFILRGRARCCGRKFSMRYSIIEAVTAGTYLWLWIKFSPTSMPMAFAGMLFFALLLLGAMVDLDLLILPDISTIGGLLAGLTFSLLWPRIHGLPAGPWNWHDASLGLRLALTGVVVGAGVVYWIGEFGNFFLRRPSMGYGDMLLMGCVGAFCGWRGTLASIFGGAVVACLFMVPMKMFAKPPSESAEETTVADESPVEEEPLPLGRRGFAMDFFLVIMACGGALSWLIRSAAKDAVGPGLVFLGIIILLAAMKRRKLVLHEAWLLLAVVIGAIVSGIFPRMQGITPTDAWYVDAVPGVVLSGVSTVVGAGMALWLLEFANLIRMACFPPMPNEAPMEDYNQIWGEGYLLLLGSIGAFCGWKAAVVAGATFAVAGVLKGVLYYVAARQAAKDAPPVAEEKTAEAHAETDVPAWSSGLEIPFGPWLALAGFLYFAWFAPYFDAYMNMLRAIAMGEAPK